MSACVGDCWELGPPPDHILFLPPPPAPAFLQTRAPLLLAENATSVCAAAQLCLEHDVASVFGGGAGAGISVTDDILSGDYADMRARGVDGESTADGGGNGATDPWLLVVVASSIGVLLLGALLALFLLKCRDQHRHQAKHLGSGGGTSASVATAPCVAAAARHLAAQNHSVAAAAAAAAKARLYHHYEMPQDNRMLWAALTPRGGTHHYVSDPYPYCAAPIPPPQYEPPPEPEPEPEPDDHYETIDENGGFGPTAVTASGLRCNGTGKQLTTGSFENSAFADYEYEEPTPMSQLGVGYAFGTPNTATSAQQDMRCISTLRRAAAAAAVVRPRVSSPTRIEHPNLPPLNLNPQLIAAKKASSTLSRRPTDANHILKYNLN